MFCSPSWDSEQAGPGGLRGLVGLYGRSMSEMHQGQNHGAVCKQFSEPLVAGVRDLEPVLLAAAL